MGLLKNFTLFLSLSLIALQTGAVPSTFATEIATVNITAQACANNPELKSLLGQLLNRKLAITGFDYTIHPGTAQEKKLHAPGMIVLEQQIVNSESMINSMAELKDRFREMGGATVPDNTGGLGKDPAAFWSLATTTVAMIPVGEGIGGILGKAYEALSPALAEAFPQLVVNEIRYNRMIAKMAVKAPTLTSWGKDIVGGLPQGVLVKTQVYFSLTLDEAQPVKETKQAVRQIESLSSNSENQSTRSKTDQDLAQIIRQTLGSYQDTHHQIDHSYQDGIDQLIGKAQDMPASDDSWIKKAWATQPYKFGFPQRHAIDLEKKQAQSHILLYQMELDYLNLEISEIFNRCYAQLTRNDPRSSNSHLEFMKPGDFLEDQMNPLDNAQNCIVPPHSNSAK